MNRASMMVLCCAMAANASALAAPSPVPEVLAPGVISGPAHDSAPAFTPDGDEVYFSRSSSAISTIMVSYKTSAGWSEPSVAPFSGRWNEMEPTMAPGGRYMVFVSNRPALPGGAALDGFFDGVARPGMGAQLWRVDRSGAGWGEPYRLPDEINANTSIYAPSIAADGSLYFMKPGSEGKFEIYRSQRTASGFMPPEAMPFNQKGGSTVDPAVAPDESFVVFSSGRKPARSMDLFIAFRQGKSWGCPIHLGDVVNSAGSDAEARLSPDAKTLYFSSERTVPTSFPMTRDETIKAMQRMQSWDTGNYNIFSVSLAPWLQARGDEQCETAPRRP